MEYVFEEGEVHMLQRGGVRVSLPGRTNRGLRAALSGDNRSVGFLKQLGYRYVHYEDGFFRLTRCRGYEDVCIRNRARMLSEAETILLAGVPYRPVAELFPALPALGKRIRPSSGTGIPELADALMELDAPGPIFLYAHLSTPHPPATNDRHCAPRAQPAAGNVRDGFSQQVECINRQLLALLDRLLEREPDAIVLFGSDHGARVSGFDTSLYRVGRPQVREYLGILNALRLPDVRRSRRSCASNQRSRASGAPRCRISKFAAPPSQRATRSFSGTPP